MVRGVRSVVDQVEVRDSDLDDDEITNAVRARLAADPATESWEIGVRTSSGEVTLTGEVDSWAEKQLADRLASAVAGVRGVTNDLRVDYSADRSEAEIREDVASRLAWDARVDDGLIDVAVDGHDVRLSGTVGSAYERSLARDDAWVIGVADVDTRGLDVASWDRDRMLRHERFVSKDDADVADAVEDALLWDPRVSSFDVDVEAQDGLVTLSGVVDNLKAKRSAAQTAANTTGVQRVKNHLKVRPTETRDDVALEREVRAALIRDPYVERFDVEVDVDDGVARLSGDVSSYFERWQAEDLAARVQGVVGVENDLDVSYELPRYAETRFYDWDVIASDADVAATAFDLRGANLADAEIRDEVSDELFWSPFVDRDEISVQVDRGVVTLTGIVDSWSERDAAAEEALEGGATAVINRLDVKAAS
jgi:osmotically-inducible protein OsmY